MTARRCRCGKQAYPSERTAGMALLQARIARSLRSSVKRQERRSYRCNLDPRNWHVTSQDRRSPDFRG